MDSIKNIVTSVLRELSSPEKEKRHKLAEAWDKIAGPKVAPHTKPSLGKRKDLWVWVDSSSLAFELNHRYRASLLKRVQNVLGAEEVEKIYFRVGQLRSK